ncbi:hypothetical protein ABE36_16250 [Bacillus subtilis]|nr:hypothetical protein BKP58_21685 [Bacillus subtilis]MBG9562651.1 hypothetical protein [Bacillus subtilis]
MFILQERTFEFNSNMTATQKARLFSGLQLVEKTTFFLQAFLFYTVSLDIHQVSDAEKALPHA